jgi:magnesium-transporting ATPase (P-type)
MQSLLVRCHFKRYYRICSEGKADQAIEALKNFAAPEATVLRDGKALRVKTMEIVLEISWF